MMNELIEALTIFAKYSQDKYPTSCEHDTLYVHVSPSLVSTSDLERLDQLGFIADTDDLDNFHSYRFGSA